MDTNRLDLNLLVTLEALLAERNVTRAAARLHLSQPAVSAQLNRLRVLFDDPLLIPAQRGMTPTARALELVEPLRHALDQVRTAVGAHRTFDPAKGTLLVTLACTDYLEAAIVKPLALWLRTAAPGVRLSVRHLDLQHLDAQLEHGEVDLALMTPAAANPSLRSRQLFDERYVLIGRRDHPKLRGSITVEQFAQLDHVIVSLRGQLSTPVDSTLRALGHKRNVVLAAASFSVVPQIVAESNLVALVPERLVRGRADKLKLRDPPIPVEGFTVGLVWHERSHTHSGQRWLREALVSLQSAAPSR